MNSSIKPCVFIIGCEPVEHEESERFAKRWFLVDEHDQFCSHTYADTLRTVNLRMNHGELVLRAPGMLRLDIPVDVIEDDDSVCREVTVGTQTVKVVDEGDLAAVWFGNVVGASCRLVKVHPDVPVPEFD